MVKFSFLSGIKGGQEDSTKTELDKVLKSAKDLIDDTAITWASEYVSPIDYIAFEGFGMVNTALKQTSKYLEYALAVLHDEAFDIEDVEDVRGGKIPSDSPPSSHSVVPLSPHQKPLPRHAKFALQKVIDKLSHVQQKLAIAKTYTEKLTSEKAKEKIQKLLGLADNKINKISAILMAKQNQKATSGVEHIDRSLAIRTGGRRKRTRKCNKRKLRKSRRRV